MLAGHSKCRVAVAERRKRLEVETKLATFPNEYVSVAGLASRGGAVTSSGAHHPQVPPAAILQCEKPRTKYKSNSLARHDPS